MILSFADRFAFQTGQQNFNTNGTGTYSSVLGGDILRAYFNGSTFILENNAKAGPLTGSGPNNNQGPGFGEFCNDNFFLGNRQPHSENATGGLALKPGSGEVVYAAMDPANSPNAGGFRKVSNQTGLTTGAFSVYIGDLGQGLFAKSAGIGDPSLSCGQPNYLQIGNRVWRDTNNDGFQDPCEPPISGATVVLYNAAKTQVLATATTNANGDYYFANTALTTASTSSAVATTALVANTAYALVVTSLGTGTATNGLTLANVSPTPGESGTLNSGQTPINNDAKPDVVGGVNRPCIRLTTGPLGSVNHTYDFGFSLCVPPSLTVLASSATVCQGSFVTLTAQVSPAGSYTYNITGPAGATISAGTSATAVATGLSVGVNTFTITAGNSPACFTTATVSVTVVAPPVVTLTSATVCAGQPASLTASGGGVGATYVFSSTGGVGTVLTITPAVMTPYTVTATTSSGCPATATATVTVLPQPDAGLDQLLVCGPLGMTPVGI